MEKTIIITACVVLSGCTTPDKPVFENKTQGTPLKPGDFKEIKLPARADFKKYEKNAKPSISPALSHFPAEPKHKEQEWQKKELIQKVIGGKSNYD